MHHIHIDNYTIEVEIKKVKHLRLSVYPTQGRIHVSAPLYTREEQIRLFITQKLPWIAKHFASFDQPQQLAKPNYMSGEIHFLEGKAYRLNVISNARVNKICIRDDRFLDIYEIPGTPVRHRPILMQAWYKIRLKVRCEPLLSKWQNIIGVQINQWGIKQMKTRWGSCNIKAKRIWLNLELAKRPDDSLELVIVHELMHLLENGHNANFRALMDKFLPDWRGRKDHLDRFRSVHREA